MYNFWPVEAMVPVASVFIHRRSKRGSSLFILCGLCDPSLLWLTLFSSSVFRCLMSGTEVASIACSSREKA